jgi:chromosome segregation ATPase
VQAKEAGGKVRVGKDNLRGLKAQHEDLQERIQHPDGAEEQSCAELRKELARVKQSAAAAKKELAKLQTQKQVIEVCPPVVQFVQRASVFP